MTGVIHGIVAPCFIFWSSTEARNPAINQLLLLKYRMSCACSIFSNVEEISMGMATSGNNEIGNLSVEVVAPERKIYSIEAPEVPVNSGAPEYSDSSKIPDACLNRNSEIGDLNVEALEGKIYSNEAPEVADDLRAREYYDSSKIPGACLNRCK